MPSALENFLLRNSVVPEKSLPLVHSTKSYNLKSIIESEAIKPKKCDVFLNESLNYFFVGRPSYKYSTSSNSADHWELPCCFIFSTDIVKKPRRIFPFDSGAFSKGRFPDYIEMMPRDEFETNIPDAPERIIGSFFGSAERYFKLESKSSNLFDQEFSLSPFDAEISAILRLAGERTNSDFDDRRLAIEIQSDQAVTLSTNKPLAVVLPEQYLSIESVIDKIQNQWDAEPIGYPMYSLSISCYHALIYHEIYKYYKRNNFL
ncbi:hypothetical protein [Novosphingobium sp. KACC 22771]|uniref:hypothetical protein n=1 Tax=Novosphingobium sp. KACC 22771 TaxID=3025670 RepID=UPI002366EF91|nr:hypothetical protein [Novosphingobium sp. KACC 22771]WDF71458.1 hypothetical protein PQ467_11640 [Novosphingobium sp. KACC 22771]